MIPAAISKKHITYAACGQCGRVYCTGDHASCPECHGRRRSAITGFVPVYEADELPARKLPGR